jgi:hypothetical protein
MGCVCPEPRLPGLVCPRPRTAALITWGACAPSPACRGLCAPGPERARRPAPARSRVSRRERGLDHQTACKTGRTAGAFIRDRSIHQSLTFIGSSRRNGSQRPKREPTPQREPTGANGSQRKPTGANHKRSRRLRRPLPHGPVRQHVPIRTPPLHPPPIKLLLVQRGVQPALPQQLPMGPRLHH